MTRSRTAVVLVSRKDPDWSDSCKTAMGARGMDVVAAHNCWSADVAQELHEGNAIVIDGHLLCEFVSPERPGPVLASSPKLPVLIFNAQGLDEQNRSAAMAQHALMLEGDDIAEIVRCLEGVLPHG